MLHAHQEPRGSRCLSLHSRQPWEAGTAGSAGGAEEGVEEAAPLARSARGFADPELDRRRPPAAEAPTRTPPLKPNRSHLYAQHRCRRRSQRGPPYPPLPARLPLPRLGAAPRLFLRHGTNETRQCRKDSLKGCFRPVTWFPLQLEPTLVHCYYTSTQGTSPAF